MPNKAIEEMGGATQDDALPEKVYKWKWYLRLAGCLADISQCEAATRGESE